MASHRRHRRWPLLAALHVSLALVTAGLAACGADRTSEGCQVKSNDLCFDSVEALASGAPVIVLANTESTVVAEADGLRITVVRTIKGSVPAGSTLLATVEPRDVPTVTGVGPCPVRTLEPLRGDSSVLLFANHEAGRLHVLGGPAGVFLIETMKDGTALYQNLIHEACAPLSLLEAELSDLQNVGGRNVEG